MLLVALCCFSAAKAATLVALRVGLVKYFCAPCVLVDCLPGQRPLYCRQAHTAARPHLSHFFIICCGIAFFRVPLDWKVALLLAAHLIGISPV